MQPTQSVAPRPGITAADGDISTIPRYPCGGASLVRLGAVCTTAGAALTCRIIFLDALGAYVGRLGRGDVHGRRDADGRDALPGDAEPRRLVPDRRPVDLRDPRGRGLVRDLDADADGALRGRERTDSRQQIPNY